MDAVWTDDGDALMFGTGMLVRTAREEKGGGKSKTHVRVFRAEKIRREVGLDRDGFVLFALLAGGDYEVKGLPGCGPKTAMKLAKEGLGRGLRGATPATIYAWREQLRSALRGKSIEVPMEFPNMRAFKYYTEPKVSTPEQLHNLTCPRKGWDLPLKETELRVFLRTHYNMQIKGYLKHILPILLLRTLSTTEPGMERTNNIYGIELARVRKKKDQSDSEPALERKITFLQQQVTALDLSRQPEGSDGEDWTLLQEKNGEVFDARARIDCEMLNFALEKGVPHVLAKAAEEVQKPASSRKRKGDANVGAGDDTLDRPPGPKAKKRKSSAGKENTDEWRTSTKAAKKCKGDDVLTEKASSKPTETPRPQQGFRRPPSLEELGWSPPRSRSPNPLAPVQIPRQDRSRESEPTQDEKVLMSIAAMAAGEDEMVAFMMLAAAEDEEPVSSEETPVLTALQRKIIADLNHNERRGAQESPEMVRARRLAHFEKGDGGALAKARS